MPGTEAAGSDSSADSAEAQLSSSIRRTGCWSPELRSRPIGLPALAVVEYTVAAG